MNFQNVPRRDKIVKRAFVPKLDALMFFDYKGIEPRILSWYMHHCGDDSMLDAIKAGKDLYVESAAAALRIVGRELTDEERQIGKVLVLQINYGGGPRTVRDNLGVTWNEAAELIEGYHGRWPGVRMLERSIQSRLQERGYITTLWGRHLRPISEHAALNALVQGCAADLMKAALLKTHRALDGHESHMVSVIHDEIIVDATREDVDWLAETVPAQMDEPRLSEIVPIEIDVEISYTNWADKEPYKREESLLEQAS